MQTRRPPASKTIALANSGSITAWAGRCSPAPLPARCVPAGGVMSIIAAPALKWLVSCMVFPFDAKRVKARKWLGVGPAENPYHTGDPLEFLGQSLTDNRNIHASILGRSHALNSRGKMHGYPNPSRSRRRGAYRGRRGAADLPKLDLCLARRAGLRRHPLSPPEQHTQSPRIACQAGRCLRRRGRARRRLRDGRDHHGTDNLAQQRRSSADPGLSLRRARTAL